MARGRMPFNKCASHEVKRGQMVRFEDDEEDEEEKETLLLHEALPASLDVIVDNLLENGQRDCACPQDGVVKSLH